MIYDIFGLPRDNGADDFMDSARLASINELFGKDYIDLTRYTLGTLAVRHPFFEPANNPFNFTRDQLICLTAGLFKQNKQEYVKGLLINNKTHAQNIDKDYPNTPKTWPDGRDWLSPSHRGHLRRCAGMEATYFQTLWLYLDIVYNAWVSPLSEPNQLICMLYVAGPKYLKLWTKLNKNWRVSIIKYWSNWRAEYELTEQIVNKIETIIK